MRDMWRERGYNPALDELEDLFELEHEDTPSAEADPDPGEQVYRSVRISPTQLCQESPRLAELLLRQQGDQVIPIMDSTGRAGPGRRRAGAPSLALI
jgi:hypothetical protein